MAESVQLLGNIFVIAMLQLLAETIIDKEKMPIRAKVIHVVCVLGSVGLIVSFVASHMVNYFGNVPNFIGM